MLDENLTLNPYIKYIENKIEKNIGLLCKVKLFLNEQSLLFLYFSYIHSYITYVKVALRSTYMTDLTKLYSQQIHVMRLLLGA